MGLVDCVDWMTLQSRSTGVEGSSKHCCTGAGTICVSRVTGQSQQLTLLETKVSLTGSKRQKHSIVTGPETPVHPLPRLSQEGVLQGPKRYCWAFGIAVLETVEIKQLSTLPHLLEDTSGVGLLRIKEQQVPSQQRTGSIITPTKTS